MFHGAISIRINVAVLFPMPVPWLKNIVPDENVTAYLTEYVVALVVDG
jgi:hypothetical protein